MYRKAIVSIICLFLAIGSIYAVQSGSKSTGLSQVEKIESFEDVEKHLLEIKRAIDFLHRELLDDVDTINRDAIPAVQAELDALEVKVDFDIPLLRNVVFSVGGSSEITWTAGSMEYAGTTYTVSSGAAANSTHIAVYFDMEDVSNPVTLSTTTDPSYNAGDERWFFCYKDASHNIYPALQQAIIHGGVIQANTITADEIAANAVAASEIAANAVAASEIAANGITVGDMDATATGRIFTDGTTKTNMEAWRHGSDVTKIDGGDIYTNTVTATEIDVANLFAQDISMSGSGEIHTTDKTDYGDSDDGYWLGYSGSAWKLDIGDSDQYLRWDGSILDVKGTISADNIFGGTLRTDTEVNSLIALYDVELGYSSIVTRVSGTAGAWTTSPTGPYQYHFRDTTKNFTALGVIAGDVLVDNTNANNHVVIEVGSGGNTANLYVANYNVGGGTSINYNIKYGSGTSPLTVDSSGNLSITSGASIDAGAVDSGTLGAVNGSALTNLSASSIASGTMSGARVSGGTFGAVNGSALTALNATQLTTGTVPDARLSERIAYGSYEGDGNATQAITGLGFSPDGVLVAPITAQNCHIRITGMASTDSKSLAGTGVVPDAVRSLDADGFTVGDGTGGSSYDNLNATNAGTENYFWLAWKG